MGLEVGISKVELTVNKFTSQGNEKHTSICETKNLSESLMHNNADVLERWKFT